MSLAPLVTALRAGTWLTPERLRVYPAMLSCALVLALLVIVATGHGNVDRWDRPLGVDFSGIWVAGEAVRAGYPAQPYDNAAHAAAQAAVFGPSASFLPWPYPPYFLAIAAVLAGLPYLVALAVWQGGTLVLYLASVARAVRGAAIPRRDILIAALGFPAVAVNVLHGQNGFLSAGLIALGAFILPSRPMVAGLLLGLLAYKPQFAVAMPVAVLAGGYWRGAAAAVATATIMTLATWLAFGPAPWLSFADSLAFTRHVILESGGLESWKLQSAFAAVRLLGGSIALAYMIQGVAALAVLTTLAFLWRRNVDHRLKVAALILASLLLSPYAVDYDFTMLGPALAALVAFGLERGFAPYEKSLIAFVWVMPLIARVTAMSCGLPLGFLAMLALYIAIVGRAQTTEMLDAAGPVAPKPVLA